MYVMRLLHSPHSSYPLFVSSHSERRDLHYYPKGFVIIVAVDHLKRSSILAEIQGTETYYCTQFPSEACKMCSLEHSRTYLVHSFKHS